MFTDNFFLINLKANLMAVAHGGLMGWFSPAVVHFDSDNSPLGKLSENEKSWLSSCSYLGGFVGTLVFMLIIKRIGRKITFFLLAVPNFVFYFVNLCELVY